MESNAPARSYKHDAFISYSRRDEAFASELQKALERYNPPKDLELAQRHLNIFRDKDDFTAGEYYQKIDKHLEDSAKLMVICSPEARKSKYVNDEIRRFTQKRGAAHIIPIILSGIPNNEAKPGQEEDLAFPEALCEAMEMPLAASYLGFDSRKDRVNKDSFFTAWSATLSELYGISRSEMEQREKRRRTRTRRQR